MPGRHQRSGSTADLTAESGADDGVATALGGGGGGPASSALHASATRALSPGHRRTASHPLPGAASPHTAAAVDTAAATPLAKQAGAAAQGAVEGAGAAAEVEDVEEAMEREREAAEREWEADDASLGLWAGHSQHASWKTLEWVVQVRMAQKHTASAAPQWAGSWARWVGCRRAPVLQVALCPQIRAFGPPVPCRLTASLATPVFPLCPQHVVPEILTLVCVVGPAAPESAEVRRAAASAVTATCQALGEQGVGVA